MKLKTEIITVTCKSIENSTNQYIYEDAYIQMRKLKGEERNNDSNSWNVLLMGMDSMSRGRATQSMPKLVKYFKENDWLDFRAFQRVNQYILLLFCYRQNDQLFSCLLINLTNVVYCNFAGRR